MEAMERIDVGTPYGVDVEVHLGDLQPEDVVVEIYGGRVDPSNRFLDRFIQPMAVKEALADRAFRYQQEILFEEAGHFGLNIRVIPNHPNPESRHAMGLVVWGETAVSTS
jgi:starch phosphorylase